MKTARNFFINDKVLKIIMDIMNYLAVMSVYIITI